MFTRRTTEPSLFVDKRVATPPVSDSSVCFDAFLLVKVFLLRILYFQRIVAVLLRFLEVRRKLEYNFFGAPATGKRPDS
ncbi:unnamed protein product [Leptidea sinapis]|uniref:Uncharacterized protein n=1 Tax=Leptidea sinapis TaxID=189913 RepID=A0A5E4R5H8_9NEOP|nr:unnamed protein product [Leptidea sinapis]